MKRRAILGLGALLLSPLVATAPIGHAATSPRAHTHKSLNVLLYIDGSLGDLGFFDSANAGVQRAHAQLGVSVQVKQQSDPNQWRSQILSLAGTHRYDLIIVDASDATMSTATQAVMKRYPQQRIIDFDDNSFATSPSVSSIIYRQNQGSFLAGALAAMVADSNLTYVSHKKIIGALGGQQIPVILDFMDGYKQGAAYVDPKIQVKIAYMGGSGGDDTWNNVTKGEQIASSLYHQGASVVYQVAGGSGLGVLQASKSLKRYSIGVDSNQDKLAAGHVIGSVIKHVDNSLYNLIKLDMQGKLQGAHTYYFGLETQSVDLTRDAYTKRIIPASMYKRLDAIRASVVSGKIKVNTEFK